ncbi:MAG TPA: bifunctional tetrahydrofolate synthase/dihydrofolate synthase [Thiothrix sp.]|nr:bifunctional tetrahydrofolate synthase/dihydrofolate synthase [Thiothrix sp.]
MSQRFNSLNEWLDWQESLHWTDIDLGLNRIRKVAERMQLLTCSFPIITVAGTNGKGSTVAFLEAILLAAGYRTGSYTSPYLYRYNERIKLSAKDTEDALICTAFEAIDNARAGTNSDDAGKNEEDISLTYFEFATLAAMWIFKQQKVDVAILEVGMGGRLDAVNLWDADVAIITSIGIDHVKWLGDNREDIGFEKSGIMRSGKPVVSGDPKPPVSIAKHATDIKAILYQVGEHFLWNLEANDWHLTIADSSKTELTALPFPALKGNFQFNNAAVAITALFLLKDKIATNERSIRDGLQQVRLLGRLEQIQTAPDIILDVAHNAHAAKQLAQWLSENNVADLSEQKLERNPEENRIDNQLGKTYALFSMLDDKDIGEVVAVMHPHIDEWFVSSLDDPRGLQVDDVVHKMQQVKVIGSRIHPFDTLQEAWKACKLQLKPADKVIVFGSFLVLCQFKVIF